MNRLSKNEEKLRDLLNNQKFEYDPQHWEQAEKLLAKKAADPYAFKAVWLTLPLLVLSAVIIKFLAPGATPSAKDGALLTEEVVPNNSKEQAAILDFDATVSSKKEPQAIAAKPTKPLTDFSNTDDTHLPQISDVAPSDNSTQNENLNTEVNTTVKKELPKTLNAGIEIKKPSTKEETPDNNSVIEGGDLEMASVQKQEEEEKEDSSITSETEIVKDKNPIAIQQEIDEGTKEKKDKKEQQNVNAKKQVLVKNSISALLGFNYSRLLKTNGNGYFNAPYFGVQYQRVLNNKLTFRAGLAYSYVNTEGFEKEYTTTQYSFGITTESTTIQTNRLHYLELPLLLNYKAFKRVSLSTGANILYLLNTNNTLERNRFTTLDKETTETTNANRYNEGISPWDIQLQLGAEYQLNKRLYFGVLANTGLVDISRNNYYNNTIINRNSRVQLYLKYDILRF